MWLHLVLLVQLVGFPWPVVQAAYRVDSSLKRGRYPPPSHPGDYPGPEYPAVTTNVDSEDKHNNQEDPRPRPVYPSDYYNRHTQERLTNGPVSMPPPLHSEKERSSPGRTASSSQNRWPSGDRRMAPPHAMGLLPGLPNEIITPQPVLHSALGVAILYSRERGLICSGVHLKPWILITTADCVFGKHPEDLYARIMKRGERHSPVTLLVEVSFYEIHPGYHYSDYKSHNLAIVVLNSKYNWVVDEFLIPKPVKDNTIPEPLVTYVNEWNEWKTPHNMSYILSTEEKSITKNYTVCNGDKPDKSFFCVSAGSFYDVYEQMDIGVPLFYKNESSKVLMGLYSGKAVNNGVTGHVFLSIYENLFWIGEKLFEYPLPPAFH